MIKISKGLVWKCPNCHSLLEKKLESESSDLFADISGTNTCKECGMTYSSKDVYNKKFDLSIAEIRKIYGDEPIDKGINLLINILEDNNQNYDARIEALNALSEIGGDGIFEVFKGISKNPGQDERVLRALKDLNKYSKQDVENTFSKKKWWKFWK
jgi:hypothetical protein